MNFYKDINSTTEKQHRKKCFVSVNLIKMFSVYEYVKCDRISVANLAIL